MVLWRSSIGNDYNLQSKCSLKYNVSPSSLKRGAKNNVATKTSTKKSSEKDKNNGKDSTVTKSTISMDLTHKILGYLK